MRRTGLALPEIVEHKGMLLAEDKVQLVVTLVAEVSIDPGTLVARHTHPGIESGYVVSGGLELPIEGQPTRMLKPGDGFQVPVATPHAGAKNGDTKTVLVSTYVVEKGKPLATPA